jgi:hypothetical protein
MTPVELGRIWPGAMPSAPATPAHRRSAVATPSGAHTFEILLLTTIAPRDGSSRRRRPMMTGAPGKALRVKTAAKSGVGLSSAMRVRFMAAGLGTSTGTNSKRVEPTRKPAGKMAWVESQARCASREAKVRVVLAMGCLVAGKWRARADELAIALHVVQSAHGWPVLVTAQVGQGIGRPFARIGMGPLGGQQRLGRVRGVLEQVVPRGCISVSISRISWRMAIMASQKRSSSALRFAFRGLDHQRARDGEGHGRRVEAVVHEALGHVLGLDARRFLERAQIDDALVGDPALLAAVDDREVILQALGDVVGVENGDLVAWVSPAAPIMRA